MFCGTPFPKKQVHLAPRRCFWHRGETPSHASCRCLLHSAPQEDTFSERRLFSETKALANPSSGSCNDARNQHHIASETGSKSHILNVVFSCRDLFSSYLCQSYLCTLTAACEWRCFTPFHPADGVGTLTEIKPLIRANYDFTPTALCMKLQTIQSWVISEILISCSHVNIELWLRKSPKHAGISKRSCQTQQSPLNPN